MKTELYGARIRVNVDEIEQGERCTSYFVKLERQKAKHKMMTTLITDNETIINKQDDILNETAEFYKRLYTSGKTDNSSQNVLLNKMTFLHTRVGDHRCVSKWYTTYVGDRFSEVMTQVTYAT